MKHTEEPIYHFFAELPEGHHLYETDVHCFKCNHLVDAVEGGCQCGWFETSKGPMCWGCFVKSYDNYGEDDEQGETDWEFETLAWEWDDNV